MLLFSVQYDHLKDINIGVVTYGLAFHLTNTPVLRAPHHTEQWLEQARNYVLSRAERLAGAAETVRGENEEICEELNRLAAEHQVTLKREEIK